MQADLPPVLMARRLHLIQIERQRAARVLQVLDLVPVCHGRLSDASVVVVMWPSRTSVVSMNEDIPINDRPKI